MSDDKIYALMDDVDENDYTREQVKNKILKLVSDIYDNRMCINCNCYIEEDGYCNNSVGDYISKDYLQTCKYFETEVKK